MTDSLAVSAANGCISGNRVSAPILRRAAIGLMVLMLSACASMPTSGPTAEVVIRNAEAATGALPPYTLVDLNVAPADYSVAPESADLVKLEALGAKGIDTDQEEIRSGDTLTISVFEVGVSLFGGSGAASAAAADPMRTPTASAQVLAIQVRDDGTVELPYVGRVFAAGRHPEAVASSIEGRLRGFSENPSVNVAIADSLRNVVYVSGVASRPGRYRLSSAHESLLDVLALAGGSPTDSNDIQLTLVRDGQEIVVPLNQIDRGGLADIRLAAGDRIVLDQVQQTFTVFGATDRVSEIPFKAKSVSLAEAIARAGGPSDWRANPRGVYVFRYETDKDGNPHPIVFRINMLKPESYFVAQTFSMQNKDVILFANSKAGLTQKLFALLSQLFNPVVAVKTATQ